MQPCNFLTRLKDIRHDKYTNSKTQMKIQKDCPNCDKKDVFAKCKFHTKKEADRQEYSWYEGSLTAIARSRAKNASSEFITPLHANKERYFKKWKTVRSAYLKQKKLTKKRFGMKNTLRIHVVRDECVECFLGTDPEGKCEFHRLQEIEFSERRCFKKLMKELIHRKRMISEQEFQTKRLSYEKDMLSTRLKLEQQVFAPVQEEE